MHNAESRSRRVRRDTLAVAGALLLSVGLGAPPAGASESSPTTTSEIAAAPRTSPPSGAVLSTVSKPVPGGVLEVTEYENAVEVVGRIASCDIKGTASKPSLISGRRLQSVVTWDVKGCANKVTLTHIIGDVRFGTRLDLARWDGTRKAPTHQAHTLSRGCAKGSIVSALTISLSRYDYSYYQSKPLKISKC
ncbi:hypothetical protein FB561_5972 [Kribbella amoyensis]|uniref:Uncharacterized protein n=1 Tax=Kribbella amoyensis TaxID=996641 RepID=A0A561C0T4_9ACTN|nr:hypothetical protein [Kribbella amoyensis]TWD84776.1 hypothetical protein FB561_5972 [Kribbella amoyensis]